MSQPDVAELLERGAARPSSVAGVDEIHARAQARRRRRRFGVAAAVAAALVAVVGGVLLTTPVLRSPAVPFVESAPPLRGSSTPRVMTDQGEASVSIHIDPVRVAPGESLVTWLVNRGEVDIYYTPECSIDRWDGDTWQQIPQPFFSPPTPLEPGQRSRGASRPCFLTRGLEGLDASDRPVSSNLPAGWYRVRWQSTALGPRLDNPRLEAAGTFRITDDEPAQTSPNAIAVPTIQTTEGAGGDQAIAGGQLGFDPQARCFYLERSGTRTSVAWPRGWHAQDDPPRLVDAHGTTRLHVGDRVELIGGGFQTYAGYEPCPGSDGWWLAWQVNEQGD